jgi:hypothetical protein
LVVERVGSPVILFGAFDRHNLGDLLFPHVLAALLPGRELKYAGLADRDLRPHGGHRVEAVGRVIAELGRRPATLVHVGGELLTCDAWQAAVMLSTPGDAQRVVARLDARPLDRADWARGVLGTDALAPYAISRKRYPGLAGVRFHAVGGVGLHERPAALRAEVLAALAAADDLSVRDAQTQALLAKAGIAARLVPDPVTRVAELFGERIRRQAGAGEVAGILRAFPRGYLAVQFSADFGDDATLAAIAVQLDRAAAATGLGVALFRAGAAPWHDDLDVLRRVAARARVAPLRVFESLDVWDICALLASSRGYCGSSLHGRIVATAFALPRLTLHHPSRAACPGKHAAYAATWEPAVVPVAVGVDHIARGIEDALAVDPRRLRETADALAARHREGFDAIAVAPAGSPGDPGGRA